MRIRLALSRQQRANDTIDLSRVDKLWCKAADEGMVLTLSSKLQHKGHTTPSAALPQGVGSEMGSWASTV